MIYNLNNNNKFKFWKLMAHNTYNRKSLNLSSSSGLFYPQDERYRSQLYRRGWIKETWLDKRWRDPHLVASSIMKPIVVVAQVRETSLFLNKNKTKNNQKNKKNLSNFVVDDGLCWTPDDINNSISIFLHISLCYARSIIFHGLHDRRIYPRLLRFFYINKTII